MERISSPARSSAATTRDNRFTGEESNSASPHTPVPCVHAQVEADKAIYFSSLADKHQKNAGPEEERAPAQPAAQQSPALRSHGATARPCRHHLVTSPGWFVVRNQRFPPSIGTARRFSPPGSAPASAGTSPNPARNDPAAAKTGQHPQRAREIPSSQAALERDGRGAGVESGKIPHKQRNSDYP